MPGFRSLEVFTWIARLGGFRAAAEKLHTTQPAVSQRIAGLEAELGVRLFDRTARGVALTAQGRALLDYAERMLALRDEMVAAVGAPGTLSGRLRLGVSETIVHTWLSRFVEQAHALHPNVLLDIEVDVSPRLRAGLVAGALDLAFLLGPVDEAGIEDLALCRYPLAFAACPSLELPDEPVPVAALLARPIITYPKSTKPTRAVEALLRVPGLPPPRIFGASSLSTIVLMTLDGIGVSVVPPEVVAREVAEGRLRLLRTEVEAPVLDYTASFPTGPADGLTRRVAALAVEVARGGARGEAR